MKHQQRRNFLKSGLSLGTAAAASTLLMACGGSDDPVTPAPTQNIVQLAQATPTLSILVEAVVAANLVTTLSSTGPFTVFAPTDAAFAAALTELGLTRAQLLASSDLAAILTYHVLSGRVLREQIPFNTNIVTVQTETLRISNAFVITDQENRTANITATNILATNGVVHLIDRVILPNILP
jgi:uncharacterized surface protein with fasciclin (FAS1) repeats